PPRSRPPARHPEPAAKISEAPEPPATSVPLATETEAPRASPEVPAPAAAEPPPTEPAIPEQADSEPVISAASLAVEAEPPAEPSGHSSWRTAGSRRVKAIRGLRTSFGCRSETDGLAHARDRPRRGGRALARSPRCAARLSPEGRRSRACEVHSGLRGPGETP